MLNQENRIANTQMLFAGALAVMLMAVVSTSPAEAKSHKEIANSQMSQCKDNTTDGANSKAERHRPKHQRLQDNLFGQELSGDNGLDLVAGS
jgi:hypothetical protein